MSKENLLNTNNKFTISLDTSELESKKIPDRVDINVLLARITTAEKKKNKINLVFFGLFAVVVILVGIFLSFYNLFIITTYFHTLVHPHLRELPR